jgi:signal peptidase II
MHAMQDQRGASLTGDPAPPPTGSERRGPHLAWWALAVGALTVAVDQGSKIWALRSLTPGEPIDVVGDLLRLNLIRNPGAAFSIGNQVTWLLTIVAVVVLVVILASIRRLGHRGWTVCLGLLLGGAVGNLIDRLFREPGVGRGHVVDFIDYGGLFVGNIADVAIVVAAGFIAILAWRGIGLDGSREPRSPASADHEDAASPDARSARDE